MTETFGRRILAASPGEVLAAERDANVTHPAAPIDDLVTEIASQSLAGERVADVRNGVPENALELLTVTDSGRDLIRRDFDLAGQQARGAWFLADAASVHFGWANLPF